jgi:hypothetical protein
MVLGISGKAHWAHGSLLLSSCVRILHIIYFDVLKSFYKEADIKDPPVCSVNNVKFNIHVERILPATISNDVRNRTVLRFSISALSTSKSTSALSETRFGLVTFAFYTYRRHPSMPISSPKVFLLLHLLSFAPISPSRNLPLTLRGC